MVERVGSCIGASREPPDKCDCSDQVLGRRGNLLIGPVECAVALEQSSKG